MKVTSEQEWVAFLGAALLAVVVLFPPWWQAAEREVAYRKELGHAFISRPPSPIPVDCYFVGCKTAPASYFHVLLQRDRYIGEIATVVFVVSGCLWLFRKRRGDIRVTLRQRNIRLQFSALLALLVPPAGDVPLGVGVASIPMTLVHRDEFWLAIPILIMLTYAVVAGVIYLLLTGALMLSKGRAVSAIGPH